MGDLSKLVPEMQTKCLQLEMKLFENARLKQLGYSFRRAETLRQLSTQMAYYSVSRMSIPDVQAMYKAAGLYAIGTLEAGGKKKTDTLDSMHIKGMACDYVPFKDGYDRWDAPKEVWEILGQAAADVDLEWGGNWGKTQSKLGWDCPHVQLKRSA